MTHPSLPTSRSARFQQAMQRLFELMGIALERAQERDVYAVRVAGGVDLHFFCDPADHLTVHGRAGTLPPDASRDLLVGLLHLNSFLPVHPTLGVGVDAQTGAVEVWLRQRLDEIDGARAQRLLAVATEAATRVAAMLAGAPRREPGAA